MRTITMMQLRAAPGEYAFRVRADGESFLVTYQGKPCFKMVPIDDTTIIRPDGSIKGPKPLTFREDLGGEYGGPTIDNPNVEEKMPDVNDIPDNELLARVLRNLEKRGRSRERLPLWSIVGDKFVLGSGYASQLCRRFGLDPDQIVRR